jgi:hypothetical protein
VAPAPPAPAPPAVAPWRPKRVRAGGRRTLRARRTRRR